jgi:hypothetical protein
VPSHHAREGNGVVVALEARVLDVGLGRLQDPLEEGLLVIATCYDRLVLRGEDPRRPMVGWRPPWPRRPPP